MPRLIWVFAGRTATLLILSWGGSNFSESCPGTATINDQILLLTLWGREGIQVYSWHCEEEKLYIYSWHCEEEKVYKSTPDTVRKRRYTSLLLTLWGREVIHLLLTLWGREGIQVYSWHCEEEKVYKSTPDTVRKRRYTSLLLTVRKRRYTSLLLTLLGREGIQVYSWHCEEEQVYKSTPDTVRKRRYMSNPDIVRKRRYTSLLLTSWGREGIQVVYSWHREEEKVYKYLNRGPCWCIIAFIKRIGEKDKMPGFEAFNSIFSHQNVKILPLENAMFYGHNTHNVTKRIHIICIFNPWAVNLFNAWPYYTLSRDFIWWQQADQVPLPQSVEVKMLEHCYSPVLGVTCYIQNGCV